MKPIPAEIKIPYNDALVEKGVPPAAHSYYRKSLRYYPGFCARYHHEKSNRERLSRFIEKLKEKKQVEEEREQASEAGAAFYELALLAGTSLRRRVNGLPDGRHGGRPYALVRLGRIRV